MILPLFCGIIRFAASKPSSKAAVRLTATVASHCARPNSRTSSIGQMPALLTRMSTPPKRSTQVSMTRAAAPGAVMSVFRNSWRRPAASMSRPVSPSSSITLGTKTSAPAFASASEKARPSPVLPPVTMALLPASEKKSIENSPISIRFTPSSARPRSPVPSAGDRPSSPGIPYRAPARRRPPRSAG